jgi:hypothetical protein
MDEALLASREVIQHGTNYLARCAGCTRYSILAMGLQQQ